MDVAVAVGRDRAGSNGGDPLERPAGALTGRISQSVNRVFGGDEDLAAAN